jgi:hypothetical protein
MIPTMILLHVLAITAPLALAEVSSPCDSSSALVAKTYSFVAAGPLSGQLRLSLAMPATARVGTVIVAAMKLQEADPRGVRIVAHDPPWGPDYAFEIRNAGTDQLLTRRASYIPMITRIAVESVKPSCPTYRFAEITKQYDLPVGTYVVRASRSPMEVSDTFSPGPTLPEVVSNTVRLTITP